METTDLILQAMALLVAVATALLVDRQAERRGVSPPGFAVPIRRGGAAALLAFTFYFGVFGPIAGIGRSDPVELTPADTPWLFSFHALMALVMLAWYALGFLAIGREPVSGERAPTSLDDGEGPTAEDSPGEIFAEQAEGGVEVPSPSPAAEEERGPEQEPEPGPEPGPEQGEEQGEEQRPEGGLVRFARQFGFITRRPGEDLALGLLGGIVAWFGMVAVMMAVVGLFAAFGGEEALPQAPPQAVTFMVGLPWVVRAALGLSAGFFEEAFFRGLLQARAGVILSTTLFVLAHASYEQPFMLVGLTFLSLLMAALVLWRQNIWPAVVAHATFDLVQLLVVIPQLLDFVGNAEVASP